MHKHFIMCKSFFLYSYREMGLLESRVCKKKTHTSVLLLFAGCLKQSICNCLCWQFLKLIINPDLAVSLPFYFGACCPCYIFFEPIFKEIFEEPHPSHTLETSPVN